MTANNEHITHLLERITSGEDSGSALNELLILMQENTHDEAFVAQMQAQLENFEPENTTEINFWKSRLEGMLKNITDAVQTKPVHRVHFLKTSWLRYAAAVILLVGGVATWYKLSGLFHQSSLPQMRIAHKGAEIAPGTNRAILTVGNKSIDLATNKTGIAIGNTIRYMDGEKITDAGQLLQLTTSKGGQYQAVLPDGTKVWLNAASSIKFPSMFKGNKREVEITGEAYLEVASNRKQPFFVHTAKETVQVLGTSFNINSYENEPAKTSLVEGSIKVNNQLLTPGQAYKDGRIITTDLGKDIAWKNGLFNFEGATLKEVMNQLSHWYDIDVVYEKEISEIDFGGKISRTVSLSSVLKGLEDAAPVHFRIEGRKVIVTP
jgi:hypothetical protein